MLGVLCHSLLSPCSPAWTGSGNQLIFFRNIQRVHTWLIHRSQLTSSLCLLAKLILSGILRPSLQILSPQVVVDEYQRRQAEQGEGSQKKEGPKGIVARYGRFLFRPALARDPIPWVLHFERKRSLLGRSFDGRTARWRQRIRMLRCTDTQLDSLGPCVAIGPAARLVPHRHRRHAAC